MRAVSLLQALTGNVDVPGGWVFGMKGLGRFPSLIENLSPETNAKRLRADRFKMLGGEGAGLPAAHIPTLLQAMREGVPYPVKAFLVFGNNTLTTYGNARQVKESLLKLDLLVVADLFMTPTAELARKMNLALCVEPLESPLSRLRAGKYARKPGSPRTSTRAWST